MLIQTNSVLQAAERDATRRKSLLNDDVLFNMAWGNRCMSPEASLFTKKEAPQTDTDRRSQFVDVLYNTLVQNPSAIEDFAKQYPNLTNTLLKQCPQVFVNAYRRNEKCLMLAEWVAAHLSEKQITDKLEDKGQREKLFAFQRSKTFFLRRRKPPERIEIDFFHLNVADETFRENAHFVATKKGAQYISQLSDRKLYELVSYANKEDLSPLFRNLLTVRPKFVRSRLETLLSLINTEPNASAMGTVYPNVPQAEKNIDNADFEIQERCMVTTPVMASKRMGSLLFGEQRDESLASCLGRYPDLASDLSNNGVCFDHLDRFAKLMQLTRDVPRFIRAHKQFRRGLKVHHNLQCDKVIEELNNTKNRPSKFAVWFYTATLMKDKRIREGNSDGAIEAATPELLKGKRNELVAHSLRKMPKFVKRFCEKKGPDRFVKGPDRFVELLKLTDDPVGFTRDLMDALARTMLGDKYFASIRPVDKKPEEKRKKKDRVNPTREERFHHVLLKAVIVCAQKDPDRLPRLLATNVFGKAVKNRIMSYLNGELLAFGKKLKENPNAEFDPEVKTVLEACILNPALRKCFNFSKIELAIIFKIQLNQVCFREITKNSVLKARIKLLDGYPNFASRSPYMYQFVFDAEALAQHILKGKERNAIWPMCGNTVKEAVQTDKALRDDLWKEFARELDDQVQTNTVKLLNVINTFELDKEEFAEETVLAIQRFSFNWLKLLHEMPRLISNVELVDKFDDDIAKFKALGILSRRELLSDEQKQKITNKLEALKGSPALTGEVLFEFFAENDNQHEYSELLDDDVKTKIVNYFIQSVNDNKEFTLEQQAFVQQFFTQDNYQALVSTLPGCVQFANWLNVPEVVEGEGPFLNPQFVKHAFDEFNEPRDILLRTIFSSCNWAFTDEHYVLFINRITDVNKIEQFADIFDIEGFEENFYVNCPVEDKQKLITLYNRAATYYTRDANPRNCDELFVYADNEINFEATLAFYKESFVNQRAPAPLRVKFEDALINSCENNKLIEIMKAAQSSEGCEVLLAKIYKHFNDNSNHFLREEIASFNNNIDCRRLTSCIEHNKELVSMLKKFPGLLEKYFGFVVVLYKDALKIEGIIQFLAEENNPAHITTLNNLLIQKQSVANKIKIYSDQLGILDILLDSSRTFRVTLELTKKYENFREHLKKQDNVADYLLPKQDDHFDISPSVKIIQEELTFDNALQHKVANEFLQTADPKALIAIINEPGTEKLLQKLIIEGYQGKFLEELLTLDSEPRAQLVEKLSLDSLKSVFESNAVNIEFLKQNSRVVVRLLEAIDSVESKYYKSMTQSVETLRKVFLLDNEAVKEAIFKAFTARDFELLLPEKTLRNFPADRYQALDKIFVAALQNKKFCENQLIKRENQLLFTMLMLRVGSSNGRSNEPTVVNQQFWNLLITSATFFIHYINTGFFVPEKLTPDQLNLVRDFFKNEDNQDQIKNLNYYALSKLLNSNKILVDDPISITILSSPALRAKLRANHYSYTETQKAFIRQNSSVGITRVEDIYFVVNALEALDVLDYENPQIQPLLRQALEYAKKGLLTERTATKIIAQEFNWFGTVKTVANREEQLPGAVLEPLNGEKKTINTIRGRAKDIENKYKEKCNKQGNNLATFEKFIKDYINNPARDTVILKNFAYSDMRYYYLSSLSYQYSLQFAREAFKNIEIPKDSVQKSQYVSQFSQLREKVITANDDNNRKLLDQAREAYNNGQYFLALEGFSRIKANIDEIKKHQLYRDSPINYVVYFDAILGQIRCAVKINKYYECIIPYVKTFIGHENLIGELVQKLELRNLIVLIEDSRVYELLISPTNLESCSAQIQAIYACLKNCSDATKPIISERIAYLRDVIEERQLKAQADKLADEVNQLVENEQIAEAASKLSNSYKTNSKLFEDIQIKSSKAVLATQDDDIILAFLRKPAALSESWKVEELVEVAKRNRTVALCLYYYRHLYNKLEIEQLQDVENVFTSKFADNNQTVLVRGKPRLSASTIEPASEQRVSLTNERMVTSVLSFGGGSPLRSLPPKAQQQGKKQTQTETTAPPTTVVPKETTQQPPKEGESTPVATTTAFADAQAQGKLVESSIATAASPSSAGANPPPAAPSVAAGAPPPPPPAPGVKGATPPPPPPPPPMGVKSVTPIKRAVVKETLLTEQQKKLKRFYEVFGTERVKELQKDPKYATKTPNDKKQFDESVGLIGGELIYKLDQGDCPNQDGEQEYWTSKIVHLPFDNHAVFIACDFINFFSSCVTAWNKYQVEKFNKRNQQTIKKIKGYILEKVSDEKNFEAIFVPFIEYLFQRLENKDELMLQEIQAKFYARLVANSMDVEKFDNLWLKKLINLLEDELKLLEKWNTVKGNATKLGRIHIRLKNTAINHFNYQESDPRIFDIEVGAALGIIAERLKTQGQDNYSIEQAYQDFREIAEKKVEWQAFQDFFNHKLLIVLKKSSKQTGTLSTTDPQEALREKLRQRQQESKKTLSQVVDKQELNQLITEVFGYELNDNNQDSKFKRSTFDNSIQPKLDEFVNSIWSGETVEPQNAARTLLSADIIPEAKLKGFVKEFRNFLTRLAEKKQQEQEAKEQQVLTRRQEGRISSTTTLKSHKANKKQGGNLTTIFRSAMDRRRSQMIPSGEEGSNSDANNDDWGDEVISAETQEVEETPTPTQQSQSPSDAAAAPEAQPTTKPTRRTERALPSTPSRKAHNGEKKGGDKQAATALSQMGQQGRTVASSRQQQQSSGEIRPLHLKKAL